MPTAMLASCKFFSYYSCPLARVQRHQSSQGLLMLVERADAHKHLSNDDSVCLSKQAQIKPFALWRTSEHIT